MRDILCDYGGKKLSGGVNKGNRPVGFGDVIMGLSWLLYDAGDGVLPLLWVALQAE